MAAGPRSDDVSMMEATAGAHQPAWFNWLNLLVGVVGVWCGSQKLPAERVRRTAGSPDAGRARPGGLRVEADQAAAGR